MAHRQTPEQILAKLREIQAYMLEKPDAPKRTVSEKFSIGLVQLRAWEAEGLLKFIDPKLRPKGYGRMSYGSHKQ